MEDLGLTAAPPGPEFPVDAVSIVAVAAVAGDDVVRRTDLHQTPVVDPGDRLTELFHLGEPVTDEHDRASVAPELLDPLGALALEPFVADREDLVDEEHVGLDVGGHGEAEAHEHARRVVLHRGVDELLEPRELDDVVEAPIEVTFGEAEDRAVQVDVLASAQLHVEAGAEFEQRGQTADVRHAPALGTKDAGEALEQRALARAVRTDDTEGLAGKDLEIDVAERPELLVPRAAPLEDRRLEVLVLLLVEPEALPQLFDDNGGARHDLHSVSDPTPDSEPSVTIGGRAVHPGPSSTGIASSGLP